MSLVVTSAPHEDESGFGYYRRLAADNVLSGWRELAGLAGIQRHRGALLGNPDFVAAELGLEPDWSQHASMREASSRTMGRLQRLQSEAVCPACLAESAYLRQCWTHAYVTACAKHRLQLVDRCDRCGDALSSNRYHIDRCDCGNDLQRLPRVASTSSQHWLSSLIASGGTDCGGEAPSLAPTDIAALCKLVALLCLNARSDRPPMHRGASLPASVAEAVNFLAPLETLLSEWPANFRNHVDGRFVAGRPDARTLNTLLGPWYTALRTLCLGTALEPFLAVVIAVAAQSFNGVLGLDAAKGMAADATGFLRAPEVAKLIGVSVSRLHKAMASGDLEHRTRRTGTRGHLFEIPRAEVSRIQRARSEWMSEAQAGEMAGVSASVLAHMMEAEVIMSDVRWREDILKGGRIKRQSVLDLFQRLTACDVVALSADDEKVQWSQLTSRRMGEREAIRALMQAIADGAVKPVSRGRRIGDVAFGRADVASYFGAPLLEAGLSIQQLARTSGWKWESIAHWIDEGLLDSQVVRLRGQDCRVVMPAQLLAFRQTYVPLSDLAKSVGSKSSALTKLLNGVETVGAKPLPGGASRGALIRLSELVRLAVLGARAGEDLFVPGVQLGVFASDSQGL